MEDVHRQHYSVAAEIEPPPSVLASLWEHLLREKAEMWLTVRSGSMAPLIAIGDKIKVQTTRSEVIRFGHVVVFREGEKLKVWGVDTLSGKRIEISCDLVVLGMAVVPNSAGKELAEKLGILSDEYGFITEVHPKLRPLETSIPGVYVAGTAQGMKDIPDSVAQASGAASKVLALFSSSELMLEKVAKS